jgi:hypothetical protein
MIATNSTVHSSVPNPDPYYRMPLSLPYPDPSNKEKKIKRNVNFSILVGTATNVSTVFSQSGKSRGEK